MSMRLQRVTMNTAVSSLVSFVMMIGTVGCGALNGGGALPGISPGRSVTIGGSPDSSGTQPTDDAPTDDAVLLDDDAVPLDDGTETPEDATGADDQEDGGTDSMDAAEDAAEPEGDGSEVTP